MNLRQFICCFVVILLLPGFSLFAQIGIKLSGETGFFKGEGSSTTNSHLALRFNALGNYKYIDRKNSFNLKLRVRPKFYGTTNSTSIVKFAAESDYMRRSKKLNWGVGFVRQFYSYNNPRNDINFDILQLQGNGSWMFQPNWLGYLYLKYFYRDLSSNRQNSLDGIAVGTTLFRSTSRFSKWSIGFYAERFSVEDSEGAFINQNPLKNDGWRIGPEIGYAYQRKFVFKIDYHFYSIQSEIDEDLSAEHSLRLLFGKIINKRWSVFVLVDTYFRNTPSADSLIFNPVYTPLNNESNIYSKIDFKIDKQRNLFFKLEYAKDELFLQDVAFTSRQFTVGLEWRR